ncbi:C45 family autoproteolytic acyltransferase/hydolase [Arcticibacterium luteifluviistationis]|uniref:Peptidase C45 n=1 Tax=Arcticibacterium luteifluviistationis TaxID=1784714 RepID=A0A2Z4GDQ9_9BACT|nr:C45 family peptidase [Arcticibacterium luteifluviistationis]AWV99155.1 peptidase C45 [Arcticibacterium luteifluviistationis]
MNRFVKIAGYITGGIVALMVLLVACFYFYVKIEEPQPDFANYLEQEREEIDTDFYKIGDNWLKKSDTGLWELYVKGGGFERGVMEGKLQKELAAQQEEAFVNQIYKMIPSQFLLRQMKYFIAYFNKDLDHHITQEYQEEIYGESLFASDEYDYIAPKYHRMLNYHAAHDIGHALQGKNFKVGCTSFAAWGDRTADSTLLIGRNFDFFVGDEFAKNKVINFVNPDEGYKLMMVSWAGMIGAVSGMNEKGLTVTLNASESEIPTTAATPISLVAREILQYAKNIEEAYVIAKKRKVFVSESLLIGSSEDGKTAIIEVSPTKTDLFEGTQNDYQICSNHFQGEVFKNDEINLNNLKQSSSAYRFELMTELVNEKPKLTVKDAVDILRNQNGLHGKNVGMGNEMAINQLIAHHGIVFKPEKLQVWVSTNPYQLGEFVCYDLNKIFALADTLKTKVELYERPLNIAEDPFLKSKDYQNFITFKKLKAKVQSGTDISEEEIRTLEASNPEYFDTYILIADYLNKRGEGERALAYYNKALTKEIATGYEKEKVLAAIKEIKEEE